MKYFTPDLLERFGSEDERVARAAQGELGQRSRRYAQHLKGILPKLAPRFREAQERFYLHDARGVGPVFPGFHPEFLVRFHPGELWSFPPREPHPEAEPGRWPSLLLAAQLDPPPREFLALHSRLTRVDEVRRFHPLGEERSPFLEWRHDEVELVPSEGGRSSGTRSCSPTAWSCGWCSGISTTRR